MTNPPSSPSARREDTIAAAASGVSDPLLPDRHRGTRANDYLLLVRDDRAHVEAIRAFYERWDHADIPGFSELLADDAEFVSPAGAIDSGGRRGPEGFVAVRRTVGNRFGSFSHEIRGLRDAQERVLANVIFRAEGGEGGEPVIQPEFHVWTFRDGEIVRLAWFRNLHEALKAAGLAGL